MIIMLIKGKSQKLMQHHLLMLIICLLFHTFSRGANWRLNRIYGNFIFILVLLYGGITYVVQILQMIDGKFDKSERGDALIFLNGIAEITAVADALKIYAESTKRWIILILHRYVAVLLIFIIW